MKKKQIRLTESALHRIIKESVNRVLKTKRINEGGNLYGTHDDGTKFTNSKDTWRGVPNTVFIWHGEWADPEIWYDGGEYNATDVEDNLWEKYKIECNENEERNETPTDEGYEAWIKEIGIDGLTDFLDEYTILADGGEY